MHKPQPGILYNDISGHYPILNLGKTMSQQTKLVEWIRCYKHFDTQKFVIHLTTNSQENFTGSHENPNEKFSTLFKLFNHL